MSMCEIITNLEAVFKILVFLQKGGIIDDDLCVCDSQFQNFIVYGFCSLNRSYRLLEIDIEGPEFEGLEQANLGGKCLYCEGQYNRYLWE